MSFLDVKIRRGADRGAISAGCIACSKPTRPSCCSTTSTCSATSISASPAHRAIQTGHKIGGRGDARAMSPLAPRLPPTPCAALATLRALVFDKSKRLYGT